MFKIIFQPIQHIPFCTVNNATTKTNSQICHRPHIPTVVKVPIPTVTKKLKNTKHTPRVCKTALSSSSCTKIPDHDYVILDYEAPYSPHDDFVFI